jgi:hypothetical protein
MERRNVLRDGLCEGRIPPSPVTDDILMTFTADEHLFAKGD